MGDMKAENIHYLIYLGRSKGREDCNLLTLANGIKEYDIPMQRFKRLWKIKTGVRFEDRYLRSIRSRAMTGA